MTPRSFARPAIVAAALATIGCAATPPPPVGWPTNDAWRDARARLGRVRDVASPRAPRTLRLALKLREPFTGKIMNARGAVALRPSGGEGDESLRMILLGPGGTTALDFWMQGDRFRFAVPAIDLMRRGDGRTPRASMRGLPVDFLRWWMLRPAEGALLYAARDGEGDRWILRDGRAVIDLHVAPDGQARARRTSVEAVPGGEPRLVSDEIVEADRLGCGHVRYRQANTGLDIEVTCEGEETDAPDPRAFEDPDRAAMEAREP